MQHLVARAVWDDDAVAADVRGFVEHLADTAEVLHIRHVDNLSRLPRGDWRHQLGCNGAASSRSLGSCCTPRRGCR
jgi:hypothetical protein